MKRIEFNLILEDFGDTEINGKTFKTANGEYTVLLCKPETAKRTLVHELIHVLQFAGEYDFICDIMADIVCAVPEFYHAVVNEIKEFYGPPTNYQEVEAYLIEDFICSIRDDDMEWYDMLYANLIRDYGIELVPKEVFMSYDRYLDKDRRISSELDLNKLNI